MWYIYRYGQQFGPISEAEFQSLSDRKQISPTRSRVARAARPPILPTRRVPTPNQAGSRSAPRIRREVEARGLGQSTAARPTGWRYAFQYEAGHALCAW